ncbi:hypothetical protein BJF78_34620 [Pseudonocardia sp. CNS-139]|nr:hypothetical protein BJF78_34620 [Pseudonocardia sp. CNS-139]
MAETEVPPPPPEVAEPRSDHAVELAGITKRFPGVVANRDISLRVRRGEVHALCGENAPASPR